MSLVGTPLLVLLIVLALGLPLLAVLLWCRVRGTRALRWAQRIGLLVCCQLAAVLAFGVVLNDEFEFFSSWSSLLGTGPDTAPVILTMKPGPAAATEDLAALGRITIEQGGR